MTALDEVLVERFETDRIDALINNAGVGVHASFADTTSSQLSMLLDVHLRGPFHLTQQMLPRLRNGGHILNLPTGLARFTMPGFGAYAAAKAAMEVLTRYQALELCPRGIRVNVIAPGAIETDFAGGVVRDNPELNAMISSRTALGRVGTPDDVAAAVSMLLGEGGRWISGQRIEVSGGQSL